MSRGFGGGTGGGTDFNPGGFNPANFNPGGFNPGKPAASRAQTTAGRTQFTAGRTAASTSQGSYAPVMPPSRGGASVAPSGFAPPGPPGYPQGTARAPLNPCCGGGYCGDDYTDKDGRLKEQSWSYVGEGSGTHEYVPNYVYVGKGAGAWVVDEKPVNKSGQMWLWGCGAVMCFAVVAGLTWVALSLFSGDMKSEQIPGLAGTQATFAHLSPTIQHHGGNIGRGIQHHGGNIGKGIKEAAHKTGEGLSHLHEKAKPHMNFVGDRISHHAGNAWSKSKEHAGNAGDWAKDKANEHGDTVKQHATKIGSDAHRVVKAGVSAGHEEARTAVLKGHSTSEAPATEESDAVPTTEKPAAHAP